MELETLKNWTRWIMKWVAGIVVITWALAMTPIGRDDTDSGAWGGGRSGIAPATDAKTGCQYLRDKDGGITPRLDGTGQQIGCQRA